MSFKVDAHAEECFFDKVKTGTKMGLMFEVAEGGFLDVDVKITGPDQKVVYSGKFFSLFCLHFNLRIPRGS